ncbi:MAG TPA: cystathionine beta-lyase [Candidatus Baltobacteraceae bacterium]
MNKDTLLGHVARPKPGRVPVNTPVQRASTILFETVADFEAAQKTRAERDVLFYGTYGTETSFAFSTALAALENAYGAIAVSSGLAAIIATIQAFVGSGQHLLIPDSVYHPGRIACDGVLKELGIETTYYDPLIGSGIAELIKPNTRLIYMESPGSMTFEVQDVPAIVAVARSRDIPTAIDNTWATGYYFNAIAHGVDVSIHAATKYIAGHSDVILGGIVTNERYFAQVRRAVAQLGYTASPDDCWLGLRGLRTLGVRLSAHAKRALAVAEFLSTRPEIERVLYPALPGAPGHALWKRDFQGATGLFSFLFKREISERAAIAMIERLKLFGLGASWGGYESLVLLSRPARTSPRWKDAGAIVRLHVGLEDPVDLIEDLRAAFTTL